MKLIRSHVLSFGDLAPRRTAKGQTMMEYIIIVALLAVASIPVAKILGDVFRDRVAVSADAMIGGTESYNSEAKQIMGGAKKSVKRSMSDFNR